MTNTPTTNTADEQDYRSECPIHFIPIDRDWGCTECADAERAELDDRVIFEND